MKKEQKCADNKSQAHGRPYPDRWIEDDFLDVAKTSAGNPRQQSGQLCQACYYAGMKHLLAGDKEGTMALFKKCLGTGEKSYLEYASATVELNALKK